MTSIAAREAHRPYLAPPSVPRHIMHILRSPISSPRSSSSDSSVELNAPRPPSPPTQVFHPSLVPKPSGIIGSAAGGSHYSGAKVHHRRTDVQRASSGGHIPEVTQHRQQLLNDLKEVRAITALVRSAAAVWTFNLHVCFSSTHVVLHLRYSRNGGGRTLSSRCVSFKESMHGAYTTQSPLAHARGLTEVAAQVHQSISNCRA